MTTKNHVSFAVNIILTGWRGRGGIRLPPTSNMGTLPPKYQEWDPNASDIW